MATGSLLASACTQSPLPAAADHGEVRSAACVADPDNALRATCAVELSHPGTVTVAWTDGVEAVRFVDSEVSTAHQVPAWGLTADTEWTWTVEHVTGSLVTASLPEELAYPFVASADEPLAPPMVLMPVGCGDSGPVAVVDFAGRIRWYQDVSLGDGSYVDAVTLGDDHEVVAMVGARQVVAFDLAGRETMRATPGEVLHHDVVRKDGLTYALMARTYVEEDGLTWVEDLVGTLDADGTLIDTWEEHDHLDAAPQPTPEGGFWGDVFPGALDAWHTDGLFVTDDGAFLLSLKLPSVVLRGSTAGVEWILAGDGVGALVPGDVALLSTGGDATFGDQHHPALLPDGRLTLFDNAHARGLVLDLDEPARTATFESAWPAGSSCPFQGSIFPTDDGWLVTCGSNHRVVHYASTGAIVGELRPLCEGYVPLTPRGVPVDLWALGAGTVTAERP